MGICSRFAGPGVGAVLSVLPERMPELVGGDNVPVHPPRPVECLPLKDDHAGLMVRWLPECRHEDLRRRAREMGRPGRTGGRDPFDRRLDHLRLGPFTRVRSGAHNGTGFTFPGVAHPTTVSRARDSVATHDQAGFHVPELRCSMRARLTTGG
jgi:hypothetical protein